MDPIIIQGPEQALVDPDLSDGGIPPAVGVQSWCVFRASKAVPEMSDGRGWTYHHHVDMACWKGRLYVGWNSCERDEDVWPARELYSTSTDGMSWTEPAEMFPQGISTCLRMYFFLGSNGRMLAIAGLRADTTNTAEDKKGGLVVREITADHRLGEAFILQGNRSPSPGTPGEGRGGGSLPDFEQSHDSGFIDACRQLLADRVFLEQQDRGRLLGARRMKWHDAANWPGGKVPGDNEKWVAGKAYSFFTRPDGVLVGVSKMGWVTTSTDHGETWAQPMVPESLVTGKAKVWTQQTADGKYALVYNPSKRQRFPLICVSGDDGVHFSNMRIVQGELPRQRYPGLHRSIGPQYIRGISHWANDRSRGDNAMWLVYSMSKEDIWVSRVPLPIKANATTTDEPWNIYCPKWASVSEIENGLRLENRDPHDYVVATRVFPETKKLSLSFEITAEQIGRGTLEIDVLGKFGSLRPVRLTLHGDGKITAVNGGDVVDVCTYSPHQPLTLGIEANAARQQFSLSINGKPSLRDAAFADAADVLHRIAFRPGTYRGIGGARPVQPETDGPTEPVAFRVKQAPIVLVG